MELYLELTEFHKKLKEYTLLRLNPESYILQDAATKKDYPFLEEFAAVKSEEELKNELKEQLTEELVRKTGALKDKIIEITGQQYFTQHSHEYDMWIAAFNPLINLQNIALTFCINATNEAIGKLESEIKLGIRDKQGNLINQLQIVSTEPPKAFISHGKESAALRKLKEFIETLGIDPLIVKKQASLDKDLPDKVNLYLSQADFVIILATGDDEFEGKRHPRQNVIHEIGLAQKTHPGRIIYLLESGAEFPSNIRPKVWESFKQRNMMDAFLGIVRELRAYGILEVTKYPIKGASS